MTDPNITEMLNAASDDGISRETADRIFAAAYAELKAIAARRMRGERGDHTLQPTALVNEAYMRLVAPSAIRWQNRSQFFAIAARAMRQVLVDHARRRDAEKRGGEWRRVLLDDDVGGVADGAIEFIDLEASLAKLGERNQRVAQVAELRLFAGLNGAEIAAILGVSRKTVVGDWRFAALWLRADLAGNELP